MVTPEKRIEELKVLRAKFNLTRPQIAMITRCSEQAVNGWLTPIDSPHHRNITDGSLRLLKLELGLEMPKFMSLAKSAKKKKR